MAAVKCVCEKIQIEKSHKQTNKTHCNIFISIADLLHWIFLGGSAYVALCDMFDIPIYYLHAEFNDLQIALLYTNPAQHHRSSQTNTIRTTQVQRHDMARVCVWMFVYVLLIPPPQPSLLQYIATSHYVSTLPPLLTRNQPHHSLSLNVDANTTTTGYRIIPANTHTHTHLI